MPKRPRARRATREASVTATTVSRKLTKVNSSRSSNGLKRGKDSPAVARVNSLKTQNGSKSARSKNRQSPAPQASAPNWQTWIATPQEYRDVAWAREAIQWVEPPARLALPDIILELKRIGDEAAAISIETSPLLHQLLRGELRLKLGIAANDPSLSQDGFLSIVEGLDLLLDGEGSPHKKYLAAFPELVACWLRTLLVAKRKSIALPQLTEPQTEAIAQCKHLALRLAQLSRCNGGRVFAESAESNIDANLIKEAIKFWGDKQDRRNAASLRTDVIKPLPKAAVEKTARALCNDWSGLAIFRAEPKPDAAYLAVAYDDRDFQIEFGAKGLPLVCGEGKLLLTRDGHALAPTGPWEEVCRHQEPEVEYWEIERTHDRGVWIQRQVVLACKDNLAYICDNIVADGPGNLTYELNVPLATGVELLSQEETREICLQRGKVLAPVLPLAAQEWRTTPSHFDLRASEGRLTFTGATRGQRMAIPWVVDLRANRKVDDLTWRQLRVAENLQNLPPDIAIAFRWQLGKDQWMAYRSLAAPSNRTVLGQNLIGDFLLARLHSTGKIKNIVEIE